MRSGDGFIVFLLTMALGFWIYTYVRGRMRAVVEQQPALDWLTGEEVPEDEATRLLNEHGYEVLSGKRRIPIFIDLEGGEPLQSRLFIDFMAERDGEYFAVKLAKERKPMERTGSAVRDRLFVYQLLDPETNGVLYLHLEARKVECYRFIITNHDEE